MKLKPITGFTLIEVLLALSIIAIALTALIRSNSQNVANTHRLKEKTISHWVAMQGVTMIQLELVRLSPSQESTQVTEMLGQKWYWRAKVKPTTIRSVQELEILVSSKQNGPFVPALTAFRYAL